MILFIGIFIVLQNGLYLEKLSIANVELKEISLKWNEKLDFSVDTIQVTSQEETENFKFTLEKTSHYLKIIQRITTLFDSVYIQSISNGDMNASFKYTSKEDGHLNLYTPSFNLTTQLSLKQNILHCHINQFYEKQNDITSNGDIYFDTNLHKLFFDIDIDIHNDVAFTFFGISDDKKLQYRVKSKHDITDIKHLIEMAHLPKEVFYWAYTAIKMKSVTLENLYGFINYNDLSNAFKNLYLKATIHQLDYTYHPKLDAIHTKNTELEFKNGIFTILPKHAYTYGIYLGKSWLFIDFTKPQEMLTLYLKFKKGKLNKNILKILSTYKIKLPFLQHSGDVVTDLTLKVNLRTIAIDAHGDFYVKKGNFDYLGLNLDISNAHIKLNNYDVLINEMDASLHKQDIKAKVRVKYNAKKAEGRLHFIAKEINFQGFSLLTKNLHVDYFINPKGDKISIKDSLWNYHNYKLHLESVKLPFNIKTLIAKVPTSYFSVDNLSDGYISGFINIRKFIFDFNIDLLHLHSQGVELAQSNTELHLVYNKNLTLNSKREIYFRVNGSPYRVEKLSFVFKNNQLLFKKTKLQISDYITTQLNAKYLLKKHKGFVTFHNFTLINPQTKHRLYQRQLIPIELRYNNKKFFAQTLNDLNVTFQSNEKGWNIDVPQLATLAKDSNFLKKFKLTKGSLKVFKDTESKYTQFEGRVHYPYALLQVDGKPQYDYKIKGKLKSKGKLYFNVNDAIFVNYNKKVKVEINKQIIDFNELLLTLKTLQSDAKNTKHSSKKSSLNLLLKAKQTQLYLGNNRYVLSDLISLQYYNDILTAQLTHDKGSAGLKYYDNTFHLYGHNFNDIFMGKLLSLSKFYGGSLDFSLSGTLDDYKAILFITNTTVKEYKLFNNILAFINTVPSLITFSIPGYDKHGLAVKQAYIKFHAKNDLFDISDIYLDSKELKILGKGKASVKNDMIDVILNLKTDLGSNLSKVPLVGYILLDGDSISTTLKITGKLTDPNVESLLAQEIVVAPLNIIQRTLTLPYKLIKEPKKTFDKLK